MNALFTPITPSFEKTASHVVRLDDEVDQWPPLIIKEAYKQLPFLQAHDVDLELDRVEESRGYATGKMLIFPAKMKKEAAADQGKLVSVPVIIRDRKLSPMDVYLYKEAAHPMDEARVQAILFRPATFDGAAAPWQFKGTDLSNQINAPSDNQRYASGLNKLSWDQRGMTVIRASLVNSPAVRRMFEQDEYLQGRLGDMLAYKEKTAAEYAAEREALTKPTVLQFTADGMGYKLKVASHEAYEERTTEVTRFDVEQLLSEQSMTQLQANGKLTLVVDPVHVEQHVEKTAQVINRVGIWSTRAGGEKVAGVAIPRVVDWNGNRVDLMYFSAPDKHAFQEKIAGIFEGDVTLPVVSEPRGSGCFVYQQGPLGFASLPVNITSRAEVEKVATYLGTDMVTGQELTISRIPGLVKLTDLGHGQIAVPEEVTWLPLADESTKVASEAGIVEAYERKSPGLVTLVGDGDIFALRGTPAMFVEGRHMDPLETEFALGAMGITEKQASELMKTAALLGKVDVPSYRAVVTKAHADRAMVTKVATGLARFPKLSVNLLEELAWMTGMDKQASVVMGRETADAVLALNFVTPENAMTFVRALPELEKSASRLAEILVASRLGMDEVRESSAKNAMTQMMNVIRGLERLQSKVQ